MTVNGKGIKLLSDGSAVRAFCYISDAVTGIIKAMLVNENKTVFNIANETEAKSIREVVTLIQEIFPTLVVAVISVVPAFNACTVPVSSTVAISG